MYTEILVQFWDWNFGTLFSANDTARLNNVPCKVSYILDKNIIICQ